MLQRSPSYVLSIPSKDPIANGLRRLLGGRIAYEVARRKNVWLQSQVYSLSRRRPKLMRRVIRQAAKRQLPPGYDVDRHFNPSYEPWDQRLCVVPDGDLFRAVRDGRASIVTDRIDTFTERGARLASGVELEADIIVTATGLNLLPFGGVRLTVDGDHVALPDTLAYKGMMLSGMPNFAYAVGYTNASWTLKVDLVCEHLCRLLAHMDAGGYDRCIPENDDPTIVKRPLLDLSSGYVTRAVDGFPRQGSAAPWELAMSYMRDVKTLRDGPVADRALRFSRRSPATVGKQRDTVAA
jgi:cation diffusion facilitator CzcD-associated flavoprotein CzcO